MCRNLIRKGCLLLVWFLWTLFQRDLGLFHILVLASNFCRRVMGHSAYEERRCRSSWWHQCRRLNFLWKTLSHLLILFSIRTSHTRNLRLLFLDWSGTGQFIWWVFPRVCFVDFHSYWFFYILTCMLSLLVFFLFFMHKSITVQRSFHHAYCCKLRFTLSLSWCYFTW